MYFCRPPVDYLLQLEPIPAGGERGARESGRADMHILHPDGVTVTNGFFYLRASRMPK